MKRKIVVASTNPGKVAELSAMLRGDIEWLSLSDFDDITEVIEDGETFAQNAQKKALGYARQTNLWTLADDSGLIVDALNGAPGIKSARFSGEKTDNRELLDHKNMAKVLELLKDVNQEKRTARFVCHLCLASAGKILLETEGYLEGTITFQKAGENGFGYDPIVYIPKLKKTVAQLTASQKNSISHRGNAIKQLQPLLKELLRQSKFS